MNFKEYVDFILDLNRKYCKEYSKLELINLFAWGFIEEVHEFEACYDKADLILESGDILAYGVLLLSLFETPETIVARVNNFEDVSFCLEETPLDKLTFCKNIKRVNREKETLDVGVIYKCLENTIAECTQVHDITLESVLEENEGKLLGRKKVNTLYDSKNRCY